METQNTTPEAEKTNFVTIKIDYPTCYQIQTALVYILNHPEIKEIPFGQELYRLNHNLHCIVMAVLQGSSVPDIQPGTLFEQVEVDPSELPF